MDAKTWHSYFSNIQSMEGKSEGDFNVLEKLENILFRLVHRNGESAELDRVEL
jgi:hypothetical protein